MTNQDFKEFIELLNKHSFGVLSPDLDGNRL